MRIYKTYKHFMLINDRMPSIQPSTLCPYKVFFYFRPGGWKFLLTLLGGLNDQTLALAGQESGLDVQFAFGISYPVTVSNIATPFLPPFVWIGPSPRSILRLEGGDTFQTRSPPWIRTSNVLNSFLSQRPKIPMNRPFMDWVDYVLSQPNPPLTISTSYGDDEQTGPYLGD
jgi:tripeptidyl-peptidase-1